MIILLALLIITNSKALIFNTQCKIDEASAGYYFVSCNLRVCFSNQEESNNYSKVFYAYDYNPPIQLANVYLQYPCSTTKVSFKIPQSAKRFCLLLGNVIKKQIYCQTITPSGNLSISIQPEGINLTPFSLNIRLKACNPNEWEERRILVLAYLNYEGIYSRYYNLPKGSCVDIEINKKVSCMNKVCTLTIRIFDESNSLLYQTTLERNFSYSLLKTTKGYEMVFSQKFFDKVCVDCEDREYCSNTTKLVVKNLSKCKGLVFYIGQSRFEYRLLEKPLTNHEELKYYQQSNDLNVLLLMLTFLIFGVGLMLLSKRLDVSVLARAPKKIKSMKIAKRKRKEEEKPKSVDDFVKELRKENKETPKEKKKLREYLNIPKEEKKEEKKEEEKKVEKKEMESGEDKLIIDLSEELKNERKEGKG